MDKDDMNDSEGITRIFGGRDLKGDYRDGSKMDRGVRGVIGDDIGVEMDEFGYWGVIGDDRKDIDQNNSEFIRDDANREDLRTLGVDIGMDKDMNDSEGITRIFGGRDLKGDYRDGSKMDRGVRGVIGDDRDSSGMDKGYWGVIGDDRDGSGVEMTEFVGKEGASDRIRTDMEGWNRKDDSRTRISGCRDLIGDDRDDVDKNNSDQGEFVRDYANREDLRTLGVNIGMDKDDMNGSEGITRIFGGRDLIGDYKDGSKMDRGVRGVIGDNIGVEMDEFGYWGVVGDERKDIDQNNSEFIRDDANRGDLRTLGVDIGMDKGYWGVIGDDRDGREMDEAEFVQDDFNRGDKNINRDNSEGSKTRIAELVQEDACMKGRINRTDDIGIGKAVGREDRDLNWGDSEGTGMNEAKSVGKVGASYQTGALRGGRIVTRDRTDDVEVKKAETIQEDAFMNDRMKSGDNSESIRVGKAQFVRRDSLKGNNTESIRTRKVRFVEEISYRGGRVNWNDTEGYREDRFKNREVTESIAMEKIDVRGETYSKHHNVDFTTRSGLTVHGANDVSKRKAGIVREDDFRVQSDEPVIESKKVDDEHNSDDDSWDDEHPDNDVSSDTDDAEEIVRLKSCVARMIEKDAAKSKDDDVGNIDAGKRKSRNDSYGDDTNDLSKGFVLKSFDKDKRKKKIEAIYDIKCSQGSGSHKETISSIKKGNTTSFSDEVRPKPKSSIADRLKQFTELQNENKLGLDKSQRSDTKTEKDTTKDAKISNKNRVTQDPISAYFIKNNARHRVNLDEKINRDLKKPNLIECKSTEVVRVRETYHRSYRSPDSESFLADVLNKYEKDPLNFNTDTLETEIDEMCQNIFDTKNTVVIKNECFLKDELRVQIEYTNEISNVVDEQNIYNNNNDSLYDTEATSDLMKEYDNEYNNTRSRHINILMNRFKDMKIKHENSLQTKNLEASKMDTPQETKPSINKFLVYDSKVRASFLKSSQESPTSHVKIAPNPYSTIWSPNLTDCNPEPKVKESISQKDAKSQESISQNDAKSQESSSQVSKDDSIPSMQSKFLLKKMQMFQNLKDVT